MEKFFAGWLMVHVVATEYILLVAIVATLDTVAIVGRVDTERRHSREIILC